MVQYNVSVSKLVFPVEFESMSYPAGLSEGEPTPQQDDDSPRDFRGRFLPGQQRCVAILICNKGTLVKGLWL